MKTCPSIQAQFPEYLDGAVTGEGMREIAAHLRDCHECSIEFAAQRSLQALLSGVRPVKPPSDLALRLRVAISQEQARTVRRRLDVLEMFWRNSMAPMLARGAAGVASAAILLGAVALMIGIVGSPPTVSANEALADSTSSPQFLYTVGGTDSRVSFRTPVLVQAEISPQGRVYDYTIVSGPESKAVRDELDNLLLMSHFTPARSYGEPVAGRAILSFSGTSVRG
jgi:Putative zinc-finger